MERAAAIEATGAPPNKRTLTGETERIRKIECNGRREGGIKILELRGKKVNIMAKQSCKNDPGA